MIRHSYKLAELRLAKLLSVLTLVVWSQSATAQTKCSVQIVLALDVSGSVDWTEFRLQKNGVANAFRDPEIIELISLLPGGISVTITHWSGESSQRVAIPWTNIRNAADGFEFANKIESDKRVRIGSLTAIGQALIHADQRLSANPNPCNRSVIDLSSDGRSNRGTNPTLVSEMLAAKNITINALVIVNKDRKLVPYFQKDIIRGIGSFVQSAEGYEDYAQAIKQKLLRELLPTTAEKLPRHPTHKKIARK